MKYGAINQIFWGFIIIFVDINIQNFDILPDIIGFIVVLLAFPKISEHSPKFNTALKLGIIHIILDVIGIILSFNHDLSVSLIIGVIVSIIFIVFLYYILYGLSEMAESHSVPETAEKLKKGFKFALISTVLGWLAIMMGGFGMLLVIVSFILYVYTLYSLRYAYNTILSYSR